MSESDRDDGGTAASTPFVSYAPDDQPISSAVVEAVAAVAGRSCLPEEFPTGDEETAALDPLAETIDPAALDRIYECGAEEDPEAATTVKFTYSGYEVTVESTGQIRVVGD